MGLGLVLALSLAFATHPWYDPTNDGSMYIATARSLAAGEGYSYLGAPFVIRPPGFSALIAPLLALRGLDFRALNLLVGVLGALGILGFHLLLRPRLGRVLATLVPLVVWFNPGFRRLSNQVMSDVPGWAALVGCLLLARRARAARARTSLVLGLALGVSTLLRSGNLLLAPVLVLAEFPALRAAGEGRRAALRRLGALGVGLALTLAPWAVRNATVSPPRPADQTLLYSYGTGLFHRDLGDPDSPLVSVGEVLARFSEQAPRIVHTLGTALEESAGRPWTRPLAGALVLALVLGLARRRGAEEAFALLTLLVVAFYFGYAGRLLLPTFAFAVAAAIELVRDGITRVLGARAGTALGALLCVTWIALDWNPRPAWGEIRAVHEAFEAEARAVTPALAPGDRLAAYRGWHHAVFLDRPVYSFELACTRDGLEPGCREIVARHGVDVVLLSSLGLPRSVAEDERRFAEYWSSRGTARRKLGGAALVRVGAEREPRR